KKAPPPEYICPILKRLMFDPYVVSSGQSFEGLSVRVCRDLGFTPTLPDGYTPEFSSVIPNSALKNLIRNWCADNRSDNPNPPEYAEVESVVRSLIASSVRPERPGILFSRADTEMNNPGKGYNSSSSEESGIANSSSMLPFATRPSCLSSPSSCSDFVSNEILSNGVCGALGEDEKFVAKIRSSDVCEQEDAVILLRKTTRNSAESRAALCSEKLLVALRQMLASRYAALQTNAAAAVVNLSLEKSNKVKIVRSGVVPPLIDVLKNGSGEAREHAAGAIFSLAAEDANRTALGVLGAIQPLLRELRSGTRRSRHDSALALYHLTLERSNRSRVVHLGATAVLLRLLKDAEVASRAVLVICNLSACGEGQAALIHADAVECLVDVLRGGPERSSESTVENCAVALHHLSGSAKFAAMARRSGAEEVLVKVSESGGQRSKEKAKRILEMLRSAEDTAAVDWDAVMKDGATRTRLR
ncbi:hypothetical protein M569_13970, partial [Genlisea aurea]